MLDRKIKEFQRHVEVVTVAYRGTRKQGLPVRNTPLRTTPGKEQGTMTVTHPSEGTAGRKILVVTRHFGWPWEPATSARWIAPISSPRVTRLPVRKGHWERDVSKSEVRAAAGGT